MKRLVWIFSLVVAVLVLPQTALAAKIKPLLDQPIPSQLSADEARYAIVDAGLVRNWVVAEEGEQLMKAEIHVRKHYVAVDIKLHDGQYDILYRDSENMKYSEDGTIHRKYNGWVKNLNSDIQKELNRVARLKK
ncbi:hypothetical protein M0C34_03500 [Agarivorans sp. TSD2052]|uniref:hypothetical protein n=1 Tax=Agarivorans sp. TSD2052 TaxID=2937286 RepID=UPI00200BDFC2|nr:hypothetical protein [Agarivorans sp. TSD2052]UPW19355.1 hypothetical protein M0C34_03500 [Agarivorans sp. TSD2052]